MMDPERLKRIREAIEYKEMGGWDNPDKFWNIVVGIVAFGVIAFGAYKDQWTLLWMFTAIMMGVSIVYKSCLRSEATLAALERALENFWDAQIRRDDGQDDDE